jgi:hypothetical protein
LDVQAKAWTPASVIPLTRESSCKATLHSFSHARHFDKLIGGKDLMFYSFMNKIRCTQPLFSRSQILFGNALFEAMLRVGTRMRNMSYLSFLSPPNELKS